jgi:hypothetical protein
VTDTVLMAEVLPVRQRGLWLSLINVFFGVGFIVIVLVAWSGRVRRCGGYSTLTACPPARASAGTCCPASGGGR